MTQMKRIVVVLAAALPIFAVAQSSPPPNFNVKVTNTPLPVTVTNQVTPPSAVMVNNDAAHPVPVTVKKGGYYFGQASVLSSSASAASVQFTPTPTGVVVIESAFADCLLTGGTMVSAAVETANSVDPAFLQIFKMELAGASPALLGATRWVGNLPLTKIVHDPAVQNGFFLAQFEATVSGFSCAMRITGHYEP